MITPTPVLATPLEIAETGPSCLVGFDVTLVADRTFNLARLCYSPTSGPADHRDALPPPRPVIIPFPARPAHYYPADFCRTRATNRQFSYPTAASKGKDPHTGLKRPVMVSFRQSTDSKQIHERVASPSGDSNAVKAGSLEYIAEQGGNGSLPTYQEASGAPVEAQSPLGYKVRWFTIIFLNIGQMIGTGVFSTREYSSRFQLVNAKSVFSFDQCRESTHERLAGL